VRHLVAGSRLFYPRHLMSGMRVEGGGQIKALEADYTSYARLFDNGMLWSWKCDRYVRHRATLRSVSHSDHLYRNLKGVVVGMEYRAAYHEIKMLASWTILIVLAILYAMPFDHNM
jgi:hypothetical protein